MEGHRKKAEPETTSVLSHSRDEGRNSAPRKETVDEEFDQSPVIRIAEEGIEELAEENVAPSLMKKIKWQITQGRDRSDAGNNYDDLGKVSNKQLHDEMNSSDASHKASGVRVIEEGVEEGSDDDDDDSSYVNKMKNVIHRAREMFIKSEEPQQAHCVHDDHHKENTSQMGARDAYGFRVVQDSVEGHKEPTYMEKMKNAMSKTKDRIKQSMVLSEDDKARDHSDPLLSYQLALVTKDPQTDK